MTEQESFASPSVDLYELLPAIYRIRDAQQGGPLKALLDVIGEQVDVVKRDIDGLWDDMFIETCRDWVIPYIGDLVANNPLHDVGERRRPDVARTIYYRRRKGTLPMLEELARDVTGWPAHAVAFFELICWTQNMNHLRRTRPTAAQLPVQCGQSVAGDLPRGLPASADGVGTAHIRNVNTMDLVDGPFDVTSHTVDVRPLGQAEGWHNIRNVGFFLWRLGNYPLTDVTARPSTATTDGYHFSPLGNPAPLFHKPEREADETGLAREIHVAGPIRPVAFHHRPEDYYSPAEGLAAESSLAIHRSDRPGDEFVKPEEIICKRLDDWAPPPPGRTAVDVRLGRIRFADGESPSPPHEVTVNYNYGFSADVGGGPYDRRADLASESDNAWTRSVYRSDSATPISQALSDWPRTTKPHAVITIKDNATYDETISIVLGPNERLVIQAANGKRPHIKLGGPLTVTGTPPDSLLELNGLLIEGRIEILQNLGEFRLLHSTLVPGGSLTEQGRPANRQAESLFAEDTNTLLEVAIDSSIVGALRLPAEMMRLSVRDSIIDGLDVPALANSKPLTLGIMADRYHLFFTDDGGQLTFAGAGYYNPADLEQQAYTYDLDTRKDNLYVVAFGDGAGQDRQGLLAFLGKGEVPFSSGAAGWEVYPLGLRHISNFDPIFSGVAEANAGNLWRSPTLSGMNDGTFLWRQFEGIPAETPWMWYDSGGGPRDETPPFIPKHDHGEMLIFRYKLDQETRPGPPTTLERTTVFGQVHVKQLTLASEVIFADPVRAERTQEGCVRFSYLPAERSRTPRRYRCQPDVALEGVTCPTQQARIRARLQPSFTANDYGHPAYGQLSLRCPEEIRTGTEADPRWACFSTSNNPNEKPI